MNRYRRQIVLPEVGVNGQALLQDSSVLIVGLGGLGSMVAMQLAAAGVGRLVLCDFDRVDESNLQRQVLYRESHVGQSKVQAAMQQLALLNSGVELVSIEGGSDAPAFLPALQTCDVVADGSDNFPTRFAVNAACVAASKPLVSAAAVRFEGQLALFEPQHGCYACVFPNQGEAAERCEEAGILGPVVGAMANMQALLVLKRLLGLPAQRAELRTFNALTLEWRRLKIHKDPHCPVCGIAST